MDDAPHKAVSEDFAHVARLLAWGVCLPLAVLALWLYLIAPNHPWRSDTDRLLLSLSVLLLAFLGGSRWGLAVANDGTGRDLVIATLAVAVALAAQFAAAPYNYAILAVAFAALGAADALSSHNGGMPGWHGRLRMQVTPVAVGAMVLAFAATA